MNKLYRYRPLSDFLYKELFYNELYFASYSELNDPLDLSARIDFNPKDEGEVKYLVHFLFKNSQSSPYGEGYKLDDILNVDNIKKIWNNKELINKFCKQLFNEISEGKNSDFIPYNIIEGKATKLAEELNIPLNFIWIKKELLRLTNVFFENSYVSCFSETQQDFLMWSHYASKHSGICLEFSLHHNFLFPYIKTGVRKSDKKKYKQDFSKWDIEQHLFWDRIQKVDYRPKPPSINFYDFYPVFENEGDSDLMGLSKSKWHGFAFELEKVFSTKTSSWKYEKEWRAIRINFGKLNNPEERISHYPIECLSGIYFGLRTPEKVKKRIYKIFDNKKVDINYYDSYLTDGRDLEFKEWEYNEE